MIQNYSIDPGEKGFVLSWENTSSTNPQKRYVLEGNLFSSPTKAMIYLKKLICTDIALNLKKYRNAQIELSKFYFDPNRMLNRKFDQYRDNYFKLLKEVEAIQTILTKTPERACEDFERILLHVICTLPPTLKIKGFNSSNAYQEIYPIAREIDQSISNLKN